MNRQKITTIVLCALFAAITAVLSQIAIPMPSGVPVTLQTFAIALCGFYLCTARATVSTVVYVLLGAVGVPVFSGFKGGIASIVGPTGGFIIGFIAMAAISGIAFRNMPEKFRIPVSYTHLTLPTNREVEVSGDDGYRKNKTHTKDRAAMKINENTIT